MFTHGAHSTTEAELWQASTSAMRKRSECALDDSISHSSRKLVLQGAEFMRVQARLGGHWRDQPQHGRVILGVNLHALTISRWRRNRPSAPRRAHLGKNDDGHKCVVGRPFERYSSVIVVKAESNESAFQGVPIVSKMLKRPCRLSPLSRLRKPERWSPVFNDYNKPVNNFSPHPEP